MRQQVQAKLTKEQVQTVSLLSIGAFLEHFDRMLHIHMASIINELFFPTTDPLLKEFILAFSFCSSYFLTPFGSLFFGYIGDFFGRKTVIILSSMLMAGCSIVVAFLPTYTQIGIAAPILLTLCRMIQGISGISEVAGVEIYLTESLKPPIQYSIVALVPACSIIGSTAALGITCLFSNTKFFIQDSWRLAFFFGGIIAIVGFIARRSLKEASEFTDRQKLLKEQFKKADLKWSKDAPSINPKIPVSTSLAYFFINCAKPLCFYFIYVHCGEILKSQFGFTPVQVANNNFWLAMINVPAILLVSFLGYKLNIMSIIKCKLCLFSLVIVCFAAFLIHFSNSKILFIFQCFFVFTRFDYIPAAPILVQYFPILKRFRYTSFIRSIAATLTYIVASFCLVYSTKKLGYFGILLVFIPFGVCFVWGIHYFEKMEKNRLLKDKKVLLPVIF
jgi:MHS family proline/betaine transporter-like MFS transporter